MAERPRELGDFKKARVNGGTDSHSLKGFSQVSPLPLTDPYHIVIKKFLLLGLAADYRCRRWCDQHCGRPSDVYDTDRRTKLTALETISRWLLLNKSSSAVAIPSVVCLSVTLVHPTQGLKLSAKFLHRRALAILWPPYKILRRSSQGNPSVGGVKRNRGSKIQRF